MGDEKKRRKRRERKVNVSKGLIYLGEREGEWVYNILVGEEVFLRVGKVNAMEHHVELPISKEKIESRDT